MDYEQLYNKGIELIRQLASPDWTDHNAHDPGITILEQLCYALVDLNYRADFPVEDLMAEGGARLTDHFYPGRMLGSAPVSLTDWRMLLLDVPGVRNVWISPVNTTNTDFQPNVYYDDVENFITLYPITNAEYAEPLALQGLYQIDYILDEDYKNREDEVRAAIFSKFQSHRNLCEDVHKIDRLKEYSLTVEARIEIAEHPDPEFLLARILARIRRYLSPSIYFYSLQEMLAKGYRIDEIMNAPRLEHGFLDERELEEFGLRQSIRISELIQKIMTVKGVLAVGSLKIISDGQTLAGTDALDAWEFSIPPNYVASLNLPGENSAAGIVLRHHDLTVSANWKKSLVKFQTLLAKSRATKRKRSFGELDYAPPAGRNRQVSLHQSIVHQFPDVYGIGENGLPAGSNSRRKAQVRQLRAYLSFFDQLLADAFSQLGGTAVFFGLHEKHGAEPQTYFSQSLIGESPGFEELISRDAYAQNLVYAGNRANESSDAAMDVNRETNEFRQKCLTQHLLARYAERFGDFSRQGFERQNANQQSFLQNYANLSYERFRAFDYTLENQTNENVSGLERRLYYLLGLTDEKPPGLAGLPADSPGAFHLLEHILLRPAAGDRFQNSPMLFLPFNGDDQRPPQKDPYSLQLSFVFPDWLDRYEAGGADWQFLVRTVREQTPAHLKIYIHRLDREKMAFYEENLRDWLNQLRQRAV